MSIYIQNEYYACPPVKAELYKQVKNNVCLPKIPKRPQIKGTPHAKHRM